jgi:FHA domain-containing protein
VYEISVVSYQGKPPAEPTSAVFGREGGSIGRGPANTLVLADPNRFVSRVQARVTFDGDRLSIANASTANPLLVNDREVEAGAKAPLADGDELRVGLYVLRIRRIGLSAAHAPSGDETQRSVLVPARPARDTRPAPDARPAPVAVAPPPPAPAKPRPPAPATTPPSPAALAPLDPLLQFGDASGDPFADLLPSANAVKTTPAAAPLVPDAPRAPPPLPPEISRAEQPPLPKPSPPGVPAGMVPDQVWDELARLSPTSPAAQPPAAPPLPSNFDAFAEPSASARNTADPLAEFAQSAVALESFDKLDRPIDTLFTESAPQASVDDIIPDPHAAVPDPLGNQDSLDPIAIFDENAAKLRADADAAFKRSESDNVPELHAYFRPAEVRLEQAPAAAPSAAPLAPPATPLAPPATPLAASAAVPPPSFDPRATAPSPPSFAPRAAPTEPAGDERLLREFLAGARIANASIAEGLTPELMRRIGAMLAVAVQGTIELIATRALLKREVKADVTIISTTRNNPLKFLPDAESALLQMFGTRIPGFMAPVEAMEDAFRDLRAHEVGVIAGMHAALAQVLKRFAPDELEKRLKPPGVLEGLLPNSHEARLWQAFAGMYVDISREAQDDFQSLFGKAFLQAYENEVSRLKGK